MKSYEKEVLDAHLKNEQATLRKLKQTYKKSLDEINTKIAELMGRSDATMQHVIYQVEYQKALKKQIEGILTTMEAEQFKTISDYLTKSYEDGFVGAMYSLQKQGIPLCFPINQAAIVKAVTLDSKISKGLYTRLGEDVTVLKKKIAAEVSRGISTGASYQQVAQNLAKQSNIGYNNAVRITATEGHRIQVQSAMDACEKAKESGADIVKQWDSTLDGKTRPSHKKVDGELRELDQTFSNGLMFPGDPKGGASEVVRCRCALLQRAKWALDEEELEELKKRAEFFGLDKTENFEDYKKKYLEAANVNEELTKENAKKGIMSNEDAQIKAIKEQSWFKDQLSEDEQKDILRVLDTATDGERKFWATHGEKIKGTLHGGSGYYSPGTKTVHLDISRTDERSKRVGFEKTDVRLFFHETGHLFDYNIMGDGSTVRSHLPDLRKKMRADVLECINGIFSKNDLPTTNRLSGFARDQMMAVRQDLRDDAHLKNAVSDLFGGISGKQSQGGYGHAKSYWKGDALETEAIAHMFEAKFMKGERLEVFKKYFPRSYDYFAEFIEKGVEQKL